MVTDSKRIAKNTIMLYIRMIVNMFISLYTSRVVLEVLGVEDYGIYGVVGGVLSMFSFFNASLSGATSRFLTYEIGKGNVISTRRTFSTSFWIHFLLAICIVFLCETIGLWFLSEKLIIPDDRMFAAHVVFQLAIASMFVSISQVPYNACIFSFERLDVYAYVEIVNSCLKLIVVYFLCIGNYDKLILYAFLNLTVTLLVALFYRLYCKHNFEPCRIEYIWEKEKVKQLLVFSGWDLFGNLSVMARGQGVNMLLNMNFGPIMNAASDIATKVQNIIMGFASNVSIATRPQIVKSYATNDHENMLTLMRDGARLTFVLMMLVSVPLICETHFILQIWLGCVPEYSAILCKLTLFWNIVVAMNITANYGVQATAKVKFVSFVAGMLFLLVIPLTYFLFIYRFPYWTPFVLNVFFVIICPYISSAITLKKEIRGYSFRKVLIPDQLRDWTSLIIVISITSVIQYSMEESLIRFIASFVVSTVIVFLTSFFIVFPKDRRTIIVLYIKSKICKIHH